MKFTTLAVAIALSFAWAGTANSAIVTANTVECGGFSTCDDSAFVAAVGGGPLDVFLDFTQEADGTPIGATVGSIFSTVGSIFSNDVIFSSRTSTTNGGINAAFVVLGNAGGIDAAIGPVGGGLKGILDIDFVSAVSAVGFGSAAFGTNDTITVYDINDAILASFGGASAFTFDYIGIIATAGDSIGRVTLDGDFFAIQNIQFNFADVNEIPIPGAILLFPAGLAALRLARRKAKRATA
jgi:hypothetical protein